MMRLKHVMSSTVVIMAFLLSLIAGAGCGSSENPTGAKGAMSQLPGGGDYFAFVDTGGMRDSEQMNTLYDTVDDLLGQRFDVEDYLGFSLDDTTSVATGGDVFLVRGAFDLDDVRDEAEDRDYDSSEYKEVETWEGTSPYDTGAMALYDDSLIIIAEEMDDVERCIDVVKGGDGSLYGVADFKDMMERLPAGLVVACADPSEVDDIFGGSAPLYAGDLDMAGISLAAKDSENLLLTLILKFDSEDQAADAEDDVRDDVETAVDTYLEGCLGIGDVEIDVARDREYLTATAEMTIESVAGAVQDLSEASDMVASANAELVTLQAAIESCLAEANSAFFDAPVTGWTGGESDSPACTHGSQRITVYDMMRTHDLKAAYDINRDGNVVGATNIGWGRFVTFGTWSWVVELPCASSGTSDLQSANAEMVTLQAAIEACLAEANSASFDAPVTGWTGGDYDSPACTDGSETIRVYDMMRTHALKAAYDIAIDGEITGATNIGWDGNLTFNAATREWENG